MNNENKNIQEENNGEVKKASFGEWWKKLATGVKAGIIAALALVVIVPVVLVISLSGTGSGDSGDNNGDNNGDGKINYTVTVVDSDGAAVKGVKVTFVTSSMDMPWTTGDNGEASYKSADTVKIKVTSVPAGYTYIKLNQEQSFDTDGTLTITLEKLPRWVIRVIDEDGNGVAGVKVQMCSDVCKMPITTDNDGYASYPGEIGDFQAQLNKLPEGYTVEDVEAYYDFTDNLAVITLTKIAE